MTVLVLRIFSSLARSKHSLMHSQTQTASAGSNWALAPGPPNFFDVDGKSWNQGASSSVFSFNARGSVNGLALASS